MDSGAPPVSVIIPVRNGEDNIHECLKAVFSQTVKPHEVILVDGNSTDHTVQNAKRFPVTILYETYGTRGGACQVGIRHASGEYIAFTDADCIPERNWIETGIRILQEEHKIGGVGCNIENVGEGIWQETINEITKTFVGSGRSIQGRQFTKQLKVRSISGCNSIYKQQAINEVGGFNVELKTCEDTELNARLRKQGCDLIYTPETKILHKHNRGIRSFSKRMFQYGKGRAQSKLLDIQLSLPIGVSICLILLIFMPLGLLILLAIYIAMTICVAAVISIRKREILFLLTVPCILILEHSMYSIGFWKSLLSNHK